MNLYQLLTEVLTDGEFSVPTARDIRFGEHELKTDGTVSGRISGGTIEFHEPHPKSRIPGCYASVSKLEPDPPDAMIATARVPGIGKVRKRVRIVLEDE